MAETAHDPLVQAEWLATRLDAPSIRLIHVSPDRDTYDVRHLPGAVFSDIHVDLARAGFATETGSFPREYLVPTREAVAPLLARWGVGQGGAERVVFYDDVGQNRQAIRGYWLLRLYGFPAGRVQLLDGGLPRWESLELPVTAAVADPAPVAVPAPLTDMDVSLIATAEEVAAWSAESTGPGGPTRILDVRSMDEYLGRDVRASRGGRIPGSRHRLWTDFLALDGRLRPAEDCLTVLRGTGIEPGDVRATYCQGGVRAALAWFVLHEIAGLPEVRNYAASWEEWGNRPDLPVEL